MPYYPDGRVVVEASPRGVRSGVGERTRTSTGFASVVQCRREDSNLHGE